MCHNRPAMTGKRNNSDPHSIAEQRCFTDGRFVVRGTEAKRKRGKRADYILRCTRDFPIAAAKTMQFSDCRSGHAVVGFQKILIRYASRLAKNVAHRLARVCGLLLL
jgi:type I site-specific restriction endonuclease